VVLFARNRLCALARPGLAVTPDNLLERMLSADIKLGTSTPKADPSGDYAFEVFTKAEALKAGSRAALERKALQLTGGPSSAQPPDGRSVYGWPIARRRRSRRRKIPGSRSWRCRTRSRWVPTMG
jgi:ABC-type molybdate transport system substrate-binding protein